MTVIVDIAGQNWQAVEARATTLGFDVVLGRIADQRGGKKVIITKQIADYLASVPYTTAVQNLPISRNVIQLAYKEMDLHYEWPLIDKTHPAKRYNPPICRRGDTLIDAIAGAVVVGGFTGGKYPWPYRKDTGTLILCGDLVEAVKTEAAIDIAAWFGIKSSATVSKWRRNLGVTRQNNAGTQRLYKELKPIKLPDDVTAKGRLNAQLSAAKKRVDVLPSLKRGNSYGVCERQ